VLVGVDDVEAGIGEEAADGGDQARPVRAGEQQARCLGIRDPPIIRLPRDCDLSRDPSRKIRFIVWPPEGILCLPSCQTALAL